MTHMLPDYNMRRRTLLWGGRQTELLQPTTFVCAECQLVNELAASRRGAAVMQHAAPGASAASSTCLGGIGTNGFGHVALRICNTYTGNAGMYQCSSIDKLSKALLEPSVIVCCNAQLRLDAHMWRSQLPSMFMTRAYLPDAVQSDPARIEKLSIICTRQQNANRLRTPRSCRHARTTAGSVPCPSPWTLASMLCRSAWQGPVLVISLQPMPRCHSRACCALTCVNIVVPPHHAPTPKLPISSLPDACLWLDAS